MLSITLMLSVVICSVIFALVRRKTWNNKYFVETGIPCLKAKSLWEDLIGYNKKEGSSKAEKCLRLYEKLAGHRFGCFYSYGRPIMMIRDPDLIRLIVQKDFRYFHDRDKDLLREKDILSYHLINLTGEKWKNLRTKLLPAFNFGKVKNAFEAIKRCAESVAARVDVENEMELNDFFTGYTVDVIGYYGFGVEPADQRNEKLREITEKIFQVDVNKKLYVFFNNFSRPLAKFLGLKRYDKQIDDFFLQFIREIISEREVNQLKRDDFINSLMEMRDESMNGTDIKIEMTKELMAAQCFIFLHAGFEGIKNALTFCLFELAQNQSILQRLQQELDLVLAQEPEFSFTLASLQNMKYMDAVIWETLRLYPAVARLKRQCTKRYLIPCTKMWIEQGLEIYIPVYGLHYDANYYPNPHNFNPDNFLGDDNHRPPFTFLPFGKGPKMCIGMEFGKMALRIMLATLVSKFSFTISEKTVLPIKLDAYSTSVRSVNQIWVHCKKRELLKES